MKTILAILNFPLSGRRLHTCANTALFSLMIASGLALGVSAQNQGVARTTLVDDAQFEKICRAVQTRLDQSLPKNAFAGGSVGFALPDGRSFSASAGFADRETKRPLRPGDPILAGSIGKTFVAAFALQLVQEGRLNLDEKIEHWLGSRLWFPRLPNAHDISVRMLMNHSSGIPNHVESKSFEKAARKGAGKDIAYDDLLTFILDEKPLFAAGRGYYYSDTNYILLAMIAEQITGRTMYDEVSGRFLKPLRLDHTSPSNKNGDPAVHGYYQNKPVVRDGRLIINPQWEWAGGGFTSTAEDLARWAKHLYAGDVLEKNSLDLMVNSTSTGDGLNYGLGVEIIRSKWGISYGHDGEYPGYLSVMRFYPRYGLAVAAQINSDGTNEAMGFINSAADDFAGLIIQELVDKKVSETERTAFQNTAESWLRLLDAGKYADSRDGLSSELKAKYTRQTWPAALDPFIKKTGKIKTRQLRSVLYTEPGIVAVDFDSVFSKLPVATETVFLKLEPDGKWRVSSYSIH